MSHQMYQNYFYPNGFFFGRPTNTIVAPQTNDQFNNNSSTNDHSDKPLRFIIIRHGERVDVMFGAGWTQKAFNQFGQYQPFDENMPSSLPPRTNVIDYDVDTPLTKKGLSQSWNVGNALGKYNHSITACYSSPAFRSIQTADGILQGIGAKGHTPLRLELGLFECTSWYLRSPINFMTDDELINGGYNIDRLYRSQLSDLKATENEYQYYDRSYETIKKIIRLHSKTGGTILLVAHAPSLEVLTRQLMNGQPRPDRLAELSGKVDFCSMTIIERETSSKPWQFRYTLENQPSSNRYSHQFPPSASSISRSKSQSVVSAPVAAVYQPPTSFVNFLSKTPTPTPTPTGLPNFQYFPPQDNYPPYLVI